MGKLGTKTYFILITWIIGLTNCDDDSENLYKW
jgi:hypothetical protein